MTRTRALASAFDDRMERLRSLYRLRDEWERRTIIGRVEKAISLP